MTKCGIIAVVGAPNAGKSTLVNQLTGAKVSIVTHKAQTTRQRILGIYVENDAQVILADTPGIFAPRKQETLERAMVKNALAQAGDADAILLVVDVQRARGARDVLDRLPKNKPRYLAINKIDEIKRDKLLPIAAQLQELGNFDAVFMISALNGNGCKDLRSTLAKIVPEGPYLYDEDALTDIPQRLWAAEMVREQAMLLLHDEIPYDLHVETDVWTETDSDITIEQTIHVANDRHKAMAIGKAGAKIKEIGTRARAVLTSEMDKPVHLKLQVKAGDSEKRALKQIESTNF